MKGLLGQMLQEEVNIINAPYLAEELGIDTVESRENFSDDYENLLTVAIDSDVGTKYISGTINHENALRLVEVDGFKMNLNPEGEMLFFRNKDAVGLLYKITSVLAAGNVNVASVVLGRDKPFGEALSCIVVDEPIQQDVLEKIASIPDVYNVRSVNLDSNQVNLPSYGQEVSV
jgi:D-3-phosphoglycerate dehydrogenase